MKRENLSCEYVRRLFLFESELGLLIWNERPVTDFKDGKHSAEWISANWNSKFAGKVAGSIGVGGYRYISINNISYRAHRLIWLYVTGKWPVEQIDHISGIDAGDIIMNLREVSHAENTKNKKLLTNNRSGIMGVSWCTTRNMWASHICVSRRRINLGLFVDKFDAAVARKVAEIQYGFHSNHGRK